jgi:DNA-binding SARP family transcriptional activator
MRAAVEGQRSVDSGATLHLLGDLRVESRAGTVTVPEGSKRLLALLALHRRHRRHLGRRWASGQLWPNVRDDRAAGNLRSCIWRLHRVGIDVVDADRATLGLADSIAVDVDDVDRWAGRLAEGTATVEELRVHPHSVEALGLLPDWYDDWVIMSRERLRQRVLHALEALSLTLSSQGRHPEAVEAAILAVQLEPLRDSAQRTLIRAHLAEGNWSEGRRSCRIYVDLLRDELGVEPGQELADLLVSPCEVPRGAGPINGWTEGPASPGVPAPAPGAARWAPAPWSP